jgi:ribosome-associated protein
VAKDDDDRTARQISRSKTKRAGDQSSRLAATLMKLSDPQVKRLALDEDLRESLERARAIPSLIARRRAERSLAGDLRRYDLGEVARQIEAVNTATDENVRQLHLAEHWRGRLIEDPAALAEFPGGADDEMPRLIDAARRERDTGRPPGSGRALFRHVSDRLKTPPPLLEDVEEAAEEEDDEEE